MKIKEVQNNTKSIFPSYDECMDKTTDINNEFDLYEVYEDDYENVLNFWESQKFPITIYRVLAFDKNDKMDWKHMGVCWSLSENIAYNTIYELFPDKDNYECISASVLQEKIDWLSTFRCWLTPLEEQEVRLKNTTIQLIYPFRKIVHT